MFETATLLAFMAAVVLLALTPGPDMALIVGRGMAQGRRPALLTALGFFLAGTVQVPLLAFGLAAFVAANPVAFDLLRLLGAAWLIWRGWAMIRAAGLPIGAAPNASARRALQEGFVASLANPKSHIFLLAFLPQFVDPAAGPVWLQFALLGLFMRTIALAVEAALAVFAGTLGLWLSSRPRVRLWQERVAGALVIGLGLRLLWVDAPEPKTPR